MSNKFLTGGTGGLDDGTADIYINSIRVNNLLQSSNVKTDSIGELVTGDLLISQVDNLQPSLDAKLDDTVAKFQFQSTPGIPPVGELRVYAKSDKLLYQLDSNGIENPLQVGGSHPFDQDLNTTDSVEFVGVEATGLLTSDLGVQFSNAEDNLICHQSGTTLTGLGVNNVSLGSKGTVPTLSSDKGVFVGFDTGISPQGDSCTALGAEAGRLTQGALATAVGGEAGELSQGGGASAFGYRAGNSSQGLNSAAFGTSAGESNQGDSSVAIGNLSAITNQGDNAVAIGALSAQTNQDDKTIVINADTTGLNTTQENEIRMKAGLSTLDINTTNGLVVNGENHTTKIDDLETKTQNIDISTSAGTTIINDDVDVGGKIEIGGIWDIQENGNSLEILSNASALQYYSFRPGGFIHQHAAGASGVGTEFRSSLGTIASPLATTSGNIITQLIFNGHDSTGYKQAGGVFIHATENWTNIAHGSTLKFRITPTGSTVTTDFVEINSDNLLVGIGGTRYTLPVARGSDKQGLVSNASGVVTFQDVLTPTEVIVTSDTTASTSVTTGCGKFAGGVGIEGNLNVGGLINGHPLTYGQFSQLGNLDVALTATNTEFDLTGTGKGSLTVPKGEMIAGASWHVKLGGTINTDNKEDLTAKVYWIDPLAVEADQELFDSGAIEIADTAAGNEQWEYEMDFTIRIDGSSGTMYSNNQLIYAKANTENGGRVASKWQSTTSLDMTYDQDWKFTLEWTTAVGVHTVINRMCRVQKVF